MSCPAPRKSTVGNHDEPTVRTDRGLGIPILGEVDKAPDDGSFGEIPKVDTALADSNGPIPPYKSVRDVQAMQYCRTFREGRVCIDDARKPVGACQDET